MGVVSQRSYSQKVRGVSSYVAWSQKRDWKGKGSSRRPSHKAPLPQKKIEAITLGSTKHRIENDMQFF